MYPGIVVFVLLLSAVLFDTVALLTHERALAHHVESIGRHALTRFDRAVYRATGTIVVADDVADAATLLPLHGHIDVACALHAAQSNGAVVVTCTSTLSRQLFPRPVVPVRQVTRTVQATLVCHSCDPVEHASG